MESGTENDSNKASSALVGADVTINSPAVDTTKFPTDEFTIPDTFTTKVKKVKNSSVVEPEDQFFVTNKSTGEKHPADILDCVVTMSYQPAPQQSISTSHFRSFADITVGNLRTFSGDVYKSKIYARSKGTLGDFEPIYETPIESPQMLIDPFSTTGFANTGYFYTQSIIDDYWLINSGTKTQNDDYLIDGMLVSGSNLGINDVVTLTSSQSIELDYGLEARYFMSVDAILSVENGATVQAGDVLARIPRESTKTRDITGGLPPVAELFEARKPKDYAIISESEGQVEFGRDYKTKRRVNVVPSDADAETVEYLIPKGKHLAVQEGDYVQVGDLLMDGNPVPHDILNILGVEALANYLINEVQDVYRLQGVKINDKHIEVIVRKMLQKVEIEDGGETTLLVGETVDREEFELANEKAEAQGLEVARAKPVLQGITKASLQTKSFISAASFQETTRVLTEAAVSGKIDNLDGLKENVIVGRLVPAGTGSVMNRFKRIASDRDRELALEEEARATLSEESSEEAISAAE